MFGPVGEDAEVQSFTIRHLSRCSHKSIGTISVSVHSFKTECVIIQKYAALHAHLRAGRLCFSLKGRLKGEHLTHIRYMESTKQYPFCR